MYAIEAEKLTKNYRVYRRPVDRLKEGITRRPHHDLVEALSEVSFQVSTGDALGIIGENGAGKSTLLKILAGTSQPTSGTVVKKGKTAALLELGSGFHPEFSGRQNIYLNAALLGLTQEEIKEREKSIIEFSELGDVIDRPVKTYSSGMYVRLGFSIATSIDPDILVIDEALSVGDQRFQQKCVDRMVGFTKARRTSVICSHSMYLIDELTSKTLWLLDGRVRSYGKTSSVVSEYMSYMEENRISESGGSDEDTHVENSPLPAVIIEEIHLVNERGEPIDRVKQFQPAVFRVKTRSTGPAVTGHLSIGFEKLDGTRIFVSSTKHSGLDPVDFTGEQIIELVIPSVPVGRGSYRARARVGDKHGHILIYDLASKPFLIESDRPAMGLMWMEHYWQFSQDNGLAQK